MPSVHETSGYICGECGAIPFKGSYCMCHGLYITYDGHPYSSEGVKYETVDGKTKYENGKSVDGC